MLEVLTWYLDLGAFIQWVNWKTYAKVPIYYVLPVVRNLAQNF